MEQSISHHIHSEFDNVPKVYGDNNLNRYCSYRDNYRNKENMKEPIPNQLRLPFLTLPIPGIKTNISKIIQPINKILDFS